MHIHPQKYLYPCTNMQLISTWTQKAHTHLLSHNNLNFPWQAPKSTLTTREFPLGSMVLIKELGYCILIFLKVGKYCVITLYMRLGIPLPNLRSTLVHTA